MDRLAYCGTKRGKLHLSELVQLVSTECRQGYHEELCLTFIVGNL